MIEWTKFDWPSFATLVGALATLIVGVAAVIGAYKIGKRQVTIADRQVDILSRQLALEEAKLKADLFERRLATYEAASDFLNHVGDIYEEPEQKARTMLFSTKLRESQFLFRSEVYQALLEIWKKSFRMSALRITAENSQNRGEQTEAPVVEGIIEILNWTVSRAETLHEVFRPDLELGAKELLLSRLSDAEAERPARSSPASP